MLQQSRGTLCDASQLVFLEVLHNSSVKCSSVSSLIRI